MNYPFDLGDFNPEERPLEEPQLQECPLCKRSFSSGVFQGHVQLVCKKVFMVRLPVFESQRQRVGWSSEMIQSLMRAQQTVIHKQRV